MVLGKQVPWSSWDEWTAVKRGIFSGRTEEQAEALQKVWLIEADIFRVCRTSALGSLLSVALMRARSPYGAAEAGCHFQRM